ncbi:ATP synthase subunit d, mitochondrial [Wickerhamomyces ciferrii]|uniref:ATP synthase subunit d, mitochondrial n=1 Tax=Wickerhamomyces ciferrii (strain ATCC 14091 / BCRC 22168 / CBS 111 / JCM 3599 / NBRC 0793 / NRRL Y-1031 F-60-10) TaxID=1206466 RepID=K0KQ47_WICCF|nr:ATP synthase subunit d, mitochondrial [Wickerhamomyces ciferrii]CCH45171.1 ATP synthase subunit d, mitochondrial [Wickerhamomyces ciferrii]
MSALRASAASKLDWTKVVSKLGLTGQTAASLTAFKKRNDEARRNIVELKNQPTEVDFAHYKSVLNNSAVVEEIEKHFNSYKPVTLDVAKQLKSIDAFEAKAVENATATEEVVAKELADLQKTLANIDAARPFDQLTVDDIVKVRPDIDDKVNLLVSKGKWSAPGYKEKFGDLNVM